MYMHGLAATDATSIVSGWYASIGRNPDTEGLNYWVAQINGGKPVEQVRGDFQTSAAIVLARESAAIRDAQAKAQAASDAARDASSAQAARDAAERAAAAANAARNQTELLSQRPAITQVTRSPQAPAQTMQEPQMQSQFQPVMSSPAMPAMMDAAPLPPGAQTGGVGESKLPLIIGAAALAILLMKRKK